MLIVSNVWILENLAFIYKYSAFSHFNNILNIFFKSISSLNDIKKYYRMFMEHSNTNIISFITIQFVEWSLCGNELLPTLQRAEIRDFRKLKQTNDGKQRHSNEKGRNFGCRQKSRKKMRVLNMQIPVCNRCESSFSVK